VRSLALQGDGRIVAIGSTNLNPIGPAGTDVALVRYLNDIPRVDRVTAGVLGNVLTISGTPGNDTIRASLVNGAVAIDGVAQRFPLGTFTRIRVVGFAGNDRIDLSGVAIASSVSGDDGDDTVYGSQAADTLYGGNANDWLNGQGGNDFLGGDAGADNIEGATGNDTMDGGAGPDRLSGGAGVDTADYHARSVAVALSLDNVANDGEVRFVGGKPQTREADNVIDNVEVLLGGSGNDLLVGSTHDDTLFGGAGDDTLRGGAGNDYLSGGPGRDQLFGDGGNDQLFARDGVIDRLDGGAGFDRATLDANDLRAAIEALLA
jgi:Ca2+-binding RTX toxin-like protein